MANCETCKNAKSAPENVHYFVRESSMARMERQIKRLWIAVIVAVCLLFASNAGWLLACTSYDYSSYEAITDNGGDANIIGNDGDIYNVDGEAEETN